MNNYYAIYFDKKYYVGRVIEINNDDVILKVLYNKPNTSQFDWPVRDDISSVSRKFIFHGPMDIRGTVPFSFPIVQLKQVYNNFRCKINNARLVAT